MGKVVEKTKKKKGRPSLLDLQKRNLKQQQEEELRKQQLLQQQLRRSHKIKKPNPNNTSTPVRRSTRRNPNPDLSPLAIDDEPGTGVADEDGDQSTGKRRREKKLKLVSKLPDTSVNSSSLNSGSDSNPEDDGTATASHKKRRIEAIGDGSGQRKDDKVAEKQGGSTKPTNAKQDIELDDGPSTPLPDKKLLLFILDRLQKKDTYGVFADPVDPEELPDYHEIIEHPMDFSTIRKKLANGAYASLERFEKDVFLLCSNAMQYNSPDTIYFRQARSIRELAKKNFENLRQDGDGNEPEVKIVRRGRPPTKNLKKPVGKPSLERAVSDSPQPTLATGGENPTRPNYDVSKASSLDKYASPSSFGRISYGPRQGEVFINWSTEKYDRANEIVGSMTSGISMKHGKKQIVLDENRRNTYKLSCQSAGRQDPSSALTIFHGGHKQLVPVGLHTQYGYARSLARFAARLGPVAWMVASKRIERCLPADVKFGPGWVGENDTVSPIPLHRNPSSSAPLPIPECNDSKPSENREGTGSLEKKQVSSSQSVSDTQPSVATRPRPLLQPGINGVNGTHGFSFPTRRGKPVQAAEENNGSGETKLSENPTSEKPVDCLPDTGTQQKPNPVLSAGFQSPRSVSARAESGHPDLALQL